MPKLAHLKNRDEPLKVYTVHDFIEAGYSRYPAACIHCLALNHLVWNEVVQDAYCKDCGLFQLNETEFDYAFNSQIHTTKAKWLTDPD